MPRIEFQDLVKPVLPYKPGGNDPRTGIDCWWLHREMQSRGGRSVPGWEDHPDRRMVTEADFRRYMRSWGRDVWDEIAFGEPIELLDALIVVLGKQPHVYTVVDTDERLAVTISSSSGVYPVGFDVVPVQTILRLRQIAPCHRATP